jgi:N-methylhydantoinase A
VTTRLRVGIDVGGTFTDVRVEDASGRGLAAFKLSSTPSDPAVAMAAALARVREAHPSPEGYDVCHGTTVGTNALIGKTGARTALVTTRGFADVLALRRQARPLLYALAGRVSPPLVPRALRFEADERVAADGSVVRPLSGAEIDRLVDALAAAGVESVAVSFLNAYANPAHERAFAAAVAERLPGVHCSVATDIWPEHGEYERTSTAVVNGYIGPAIARYVRGLEAVLAPLGMRTLAVAKSNGGLASPSHAARHPVHLIESGPAAGVTAVAAIGRACGMANLIAFDMGGTTAKVGVVDEGRPRVSREFQADRFVDGRDCGGYAVRSAVIDLIEIGAGGGSIAWIDAGGALRIGPGSAGAEPGPACYGRGGTRPTVTDAHVVIGHIVPSLLAASGIRIDPGRAVEAVERVVARPFGWTVARAAHAILDVANARMAELVRLATVRRGIDPRDYALVAYGGGGPLHAGQVARETGIATVLVPEGPGMLSAAGALRGEIRHDLARSMLRRMDALAGSAIEAAFADVREEAVRLLADAGLDAAGAAVRFERGLDVRFEGQLFELPVPVMAGESDPARFESRFRKEYRRIYGYALPDVAVELVNVRLTVRCGNPPDGVPGLPDDGGGIDDPAHCTLDRAGNRIVQPLRARHRLPPGVAVEGPLLVADAGATVRVDAGQRITREPSGLLRIEEAA